MAIVERLRGFADSNKWLNPDCLNRLASILKDYTIEIPTVNGKTLKVGNSVMGKSDNKIWYIVGFKPGKHSIVCKDGDGDIKDLKPEWVEVIPTFLDMDGQPLYVGKKVWYLEQTLKKDIGKCKEIPIWVPIEISKITKTKSLGLWFIETTNNGVYGYDPNKFRSFRYSYSIEQVDTLVNMSTEDYNLRILHTKLGDVKPSVDLTEKKYRHILSLIDNQR